MVRDTVTHLFFGEDVAVDATGLADLDAGEILFIAEGGAPLNPAAITALGPNDGFYIAEGKKGNNLSHVISPKLTKAGIKAHNGTSFAAAVEQLSIISTINVLNDTEYSLAISFYYDKDIYSKRRDVKHFNFTSDASATDAEIIAGFVAAMNADADFARQAVASANGATLEVLGKVLPGTNFDNPVQVKFELVLDQGFDATTTLDEFGAGGSVAPTPGVGTAAKLKALERNNGGFQNGVTNLRLFPVIGPEARVSASGTYDVYVIDYVDEHLNGEIGLDPTRKAAAQIIIANNIATTVNGTTAALEALLLSATGKAVNL